MVEKKHFSLIILIFFDKKFCSKIIFFRRVIPEIQNIVLGWYIGEWFEDSFTGQGEVIDTKGKTLYSGGLLKFNMHGHGTRYYEDGSTYAGDWQTGEYHGKGTLKRAANGTTYEGDFENRKRQGEGTLTFADKRVYSGQWVNDELHGKGSLKLKKNLKNISGTPGDEILEKLCI